MKIIKKFNSIAEAYRAGCIKENTMIKTNANGAETTYKTIEGIIGEIDREHKKMYIWHNDKTNEGLYGKKDPRNYGYKYSWIVNLTNKTANIEIEYEIKKSTEKISNKESLTEIKI